MFLYFVLGFQTLSKNDCIQQRTAQLNKVSLFIEMCDQYPIVFDIIWALSFNHDIQQQLRSSSSFMSKLAHLGKAHVSEKMRKTVHGILWNLEINHEDRPTSEINEETAFDVMISYSHKDKTLCQQIYDELTKSGYRVWIDFDQMHGNVMDAMAQAIEQSQTVIICMSEDYRKSNYCRAEVHYAFQRQRKIVPVLLQKHYRPDGWLLFLIGELVYVNFNKHAFDRAMNLLLKELKGKECSGSKVPAVQPMEDTDVAPPIVSVVSSARASVSLASPQSIVEWTEEQVEEWLMKHNLIKMSRLLTNCDGRSLVYLSKYMKSCQSQQILNLLQEDSVQRTKQSVSLIELSRFQSLMDKEKQLMESTETNANIEKKEF
jgi:hypothetical protein